MITGGMVVVIVVVCLLIGYILYPTKEYTDRIDNLLFERDSLIKRNALLTSGLKDLEKTVENIQKQIGTKDVDGSLYRYGYFDLPERYNPINTKIANLYEIIEKRTQVTTDKFEALEKFLNVEFIERDQKEIGPEYKKVTHPLDPSN